MCVCVSICYLIIYSSLLFPPHKNRDSVLVIKLIKVETLHPSENIAVNNVPSCFGNDNWKKTHLQSSVSQPFQDA